MPTHHASSTRPTPTRGLTGLYVGLANPTSKLHPVPHPSGTSSSPHLLDLHNGIIYETKRAPNDGQISPSPQPPPPPGSLWLGLSITIRATPACEHDNSARFRDIQAQNAWISDVKTRALGFSDGHPLIEVRGTFHGLIPPKLPAVAPSPLRPQASPRSRPCCSPSRGSPIQTFGCATLSIALAFAFACWTLFGPVYGAAFIAVALSSLALPGLCAWLGSHCPVPRGWWPCVRWPILARPWPFGCGATFLLLPALGLVIGAPSCSSSTCVPIAWPILLLIGVIVAFSAMARRSWVLLGALALWAVLLGAASFRSAGCNGGVVLAVMQRAEEIFARDGNAEALSRALAAAKAPPKRALDDALADEIRCGETIYLSGDLLFRKDEYRLRPNAEPILRKVKRVLARSPEATVTLAGHADSSGEVAHNQMLSERRAEFVAAWLLRNGAVQRAKLTARGHGESQPLVDESMAPPELNRRVELTIRCPTAEVGL